MKDYSQILLASAEQILLTILGNRSVSEFEAFFATLATEPRAIVIERQAASIVKNTFAVEMLGRYELRASKTKDKDFCLLDAEALAALLVEADESTTERILQPLLWTDNPDWPLPYWRARERLIVDALCFLVPRESSDARGLDVLIKVLRVLSKLSPHVYFLLLCDKEVLVREPVFLSAYLALTVQSRALPFQPPVTAYRYAIEQLEKRGYDRELLRELHTMCEEILANNSP